MENNIVTEIAQLFSLFPRLKRFTKLTIKDYQTIWNTLSVYIEDQLLIEKSPEIPGLGIFYTIRSWNDRQKILIPQFYPSPKTFSKHPGFKRYKRLSEIKCNNRISLNFTILSQLCKINREDFEMGLKDIQLCILHALSKKLELSIVFGKIGRLKIFPEYIRMKYSVSIMNKLKDALYESIDDEQADKNSNDDNMSDITNESVSEKLNKNESKKSESDPEYNGNSSSSDGMTMDDKKNRGTRGTPDSQSRGSSRGKLSRSNESLPRNSNNRSYDSLKYEDDEFLPFDNLTKKDYDKLSESEKEKAISDLFESYDDYNFQQSNFLKTPIAFHGSDNIFKPLIKQSHPYFVIKNNLKKLSHQNNIFPNIDRKKSSSEIKEEELLRKAAKSLKPGTPHTHPYCGNRTWKSFESCPICRQNKSVEISTKESDARKEKEFDLYLMKKAEKEKQQEEEYQREINLIRYKQAKEIAEFNKQIGEQKKRERSPDKTCGSIFRYRPHVKNAILESQKYTRELKEQIMSNEEERKRNKMEQELENRLFNQKFLYEFSKDKAKEHLHKLSIQQQQRDSLLFQIEKNKLEKLEKEKEDNLMFKKCSENVFARDEQPLFDLQKQKAIELYRDQKLLERNKIMVNNQRQQKELQDDIDRLKFCQLLYKRDYYNEKRERTEVRKRLEEYWNEQIKNNDYDKRII